MDKIDRSGETNINKEGYSVKIINYRNANDIDVLFDDGTILNTTYRYFSKGEFRKPKNSYIGKKYLNNKGNEFEIINIIKINNCTKYEIKFLDEYGYTKICDLKEIKNGNIQNPYYKNIANVGYIGVGEYRANNSNIYSVWSKMIKRCYDTKNRDYHQYGGKGCIVCEEWHNFQNFAKWYEDNYYIIEGRNMNLDKDILIKNNKIYSPNSCIIVPNNINKLFTKNNKNRGNLPIGVTKKGDKYIAYLHSAKYSKSFDTLEEAFYSYKQIKEDYIKQIADEYKDKIPKKLYDAMYKWEVEITD